MSGIAKITNFFQHYGLIAPVDALWLLKFWTCPATSLSAVASLVQDCNAVGGLGRKLGIGTVQLRDVYQGVGSTDTAASASRISRV